MRICMIGAGYVGLVTGACFSEFGFNVTCIDHDTSRIDSLREGIMPIFEPGLDTLVERNVAADRLHFETTMTPVSRSDVIFIAVGTPSRRGNGHADVSYVMQAARDLAPLLSGYTVIVTKSTVPVGTGKAVAEAILEANPEADFDIVSNPEFLREGSAIRDFQRPDRVVIGCNTHRAKGVMEELYRPLERVDTPILFTDRESAELIKYASNAFLAMKITFINEMADLCEKLGADVVDVARGIGMDGRIGARFLEPGPGFGGSCFPKDTRALIHTGAESESPIRTIETVVEVNENRKRSMATRIVAACGDSVQNTTIALLGLTFKPDTDDMRESPSLDIIAELVRLGARLRLYDPHGMEVAKKIITAPVEWCDSAYDALSGADAAAVVTEWSEFRGLDMDRVRTLMRNPVMVDLRNIFHPDVMVAAGFRYSGVGRKAR